MWSWVCVHWKSEDNFQQGGLFLSCWSRGCAIASSVYSKVAGLLPTSLGEYQGNSYDHHVWLFMWVLGLNSGCWAFVTSTFTLWAIFLASWFYFYKTETCNGSQQKWLSAMKSSQTGCGRAQANSGSFWNVLQSYPWLKLYWIVP